jgi:hypothetical protein
MTRRHTLLGLKNSDHSPLLPLSSDSPDLSATSPIANYFIPASADDEARSTLLSSFMGPGPWRLEANVQLPGRGSRLIGVSNKNRRSNMLVHHTLRVVVCVSRADVPTRSYQDVMLETPVDIFPVSLLIRYGPSAAKAFISGSAALRFSRCPSTASRSRTPLHLGSVFPNGRSSRRACLRRSGGALLAHFYCSRRRPGWTTARGTSGCSPARRARAAKHHRGMIAR